MVLVRPRLQVERADGQGERRVALHEHRARCRADSRPSTRPCCKCPLLPPNTIVTIVTYLLTRIARADRRSLESSSTCLAVRRHWALLRSGGRACVYPGAWSYWRRSGTYRSHAARAAERATKAAHASHRLTASTSRMSLTPVCRELLCRLRHSPRHAKLPNYPNYEKKQT